MAIYDFIIVGSGAGGGTLAYYLNKSGANVLLLEAGRFYRKNTFPKTEAEASAELYWGGGIEYDNQAKLGFLRGRLVGGSSIMYQCLMDRFDDIALNDWQAESGINYFTQNGMDSHYTQIENDLQLHTFTEGERNGNANLFVKACDELGYKWGYLRRGQHDCGRELGNDCITCLNGCHRDSKQSSMVAFVQKAEENNLKVETEIEITQVIHQKDGVIVRGLQGLIGHKKPVEYKAKKTILAGGAFGSTRMMLMSGYQNQLPALGKKFATHPQFMWFGFQKEYVDSHKLFFQSVASKDPNFRANGFKLENVFSSPVSTSMLFTVRGAQHHDFLKRYRYMQCVEVAVRDENIGEIRVDKKGKLNVHKPMTDQDNERKTKGHNAIRNILKTAGAYEVYESQMSFGLHLMGGCTIGVDGKNSVVSPEFNVHGMENLYICDSSVFPNAPGINPSLTIMALAHKLSTLLIK
ncbi:MAG: GMC family oxidoreductase [Chitinophagales bacterium]|nr:GMC family oxidoreductase [Chitinophagales bacterium]MCZ2393164.1 GMC family oxidoreductase [Chitinophagales bacterium]